MTTSTNTTTGETTTSKATTITIDSVAANGVKRASEPMPSSQENYEGLSPRQQSKKTKSNGDHAVATRENGAYGKRETIRIQESMTRLACCDESSDSF